ncbi:SRPBCC family protein [Saccharopolyspora mangrovi]|uniref:DUF2867 domain-containing protein n=1 Tax=Saccharopolyspora mangrovi TaxID=3082379 RepID=A0ABU6A8H6_9PSEU|nr:hypothetical protein [Saccharopolyspora sp. S2-29]MEB3367773.1 hypothetical protein [Saccharopolyspora sp. S2-29]
MTPEPAHIDDHQILIPASRDLVWQALLGRANTILRRGRPLALVLGANPPNGFAVTAEVPHHRLDLSGRHRFATYLLRFELTTPPDRDGSTLLVARSYADFHGVTGRAYRTALLASRGHVGAVQLILRSVKASATTR